MAEPHDPDGGPYQDPYDVPAGTSTARARADALVTICAQTPDPTDDDNPNPTRRPELIVHVNLTDLTEPAPACEQVQDLQHSEGPRIQDGPALRGETARRLACDARIIIAVDGPTGETLDLGRASRFPNAALTRALWHRDGACQYPGCNRRRYLIAHHLVHWANGGPTTLINLVLLCGAHHRALHEGNYHLTRTPTGELLFTSPRGAPITPAPTQTGHPKGATTSHGATITPDTTTPDWYGDRLDVSLAVESTRSNWDNPKQPATTQQLDDVSIDARWQKLAAAPGCPPAVCDARARAKDAEPDKTPPPPPWLALLAEPEAWAR